jgi:hypothetical protein
LHHQRGLVAVEGWVWREHPAVLLIGLEQFGNEFYDGLATLNAGHVRLAT